MELPPCPGLCGASHCPLSAVDPRKEHMVSGSQPDFACNSDTTDTILEHGPSLLSRLACVRTLSFKFKVVSKFKCKCEFDRVVVGGDGCPSLLVGGDDCLFSSVVVVVVALVPLVVVVVLLVVG